VIDRLVEISITRPDGSVVWRAMGRGTAGIAMFDLRLAEYEPFEFRSDQGGSIWGDLDIRIRNVAISEEAKRAVDLSFYHDRAVAEEQRKEDEDRETRR